MSFLAPRRPVTYPPPPKKNTGLTVGIIIAMIILITIIIIVVLLISRSTNEGSNTTLPDANTGGGGGGLICSTPTLDFIGFLPNLGDGVGLGNKLEGVFLYFQWGSVVAATGYTIQSSNDMDFTTILDTKNVSITEELAVEMGPYHTYAMEDGTNELKRFFFRLKANGCPGGDSPYSNVLEVNPELPYGLDEEWHIKPGADYAPTPAINDPYLTSGGILADPNGFPMFIHNGDGGPGSTLFGGCAGNICQVGNGTRPIACICRHLWDPELRRFFSIQEPVSMTGDPVSIQIDDGSLLVAGLLLSKIDPGPSFTERLLYNSERKKFYFFTDTPYYGASGVPTATPYMAGYGSATSSPPNVSALAEATATDTHTWDLIYLEPIT